MDQFSVDIKFSGGESGNEVTLEGNEENVDECKEHLMELAEEMVRQRPTHVSVFIIIDHGTF